MMLPKVYVPGPGFQEAYSTMEMCEMIMRPIVDYLQNKVIVCPCDTDESSFVKWLHKYTNATVINIGDEDVNSDQTRTIMNMCDLVITDPPFDARVFDPFIYYMEAHHINFLILGPYGRDYRNAVIREYKCQDDIFWPHTLVTGAPHRVRGRMYTNDKVIIERSERYVLEKSKTNHTNIV